MLINPKTNKLEFTLLVVSLMAVGALSVDIMLPSLPTIVSDLGAGNSNDQQLILTYFLVGFGISQLFYGPLSDSFGRKPVLFFGLTLFLFPVVIAPFSPDLQTLLWMRFAQGIGVGAARVLSTAIVRDSFEGNELAKMMSLVFMVFMSVPIIAPSIGQGIIMLGTWHYNFVFMGASALIALTWAILRLPETLKPEHKRDFSPREIVLGFKTVLTNRYALSFTFANTALFATLMGFLGISPQIYLDIYDLGAVYPLMIAFTASSLAVAALVNSRVVHKYGPAKIALMAGKGFIALSLLWAILAWQLDHIPLWLFICVHQPIMLCFGFAGTNQISAAMLPLGKVAGTASSTIGFVHTVGGALLGALIGYFYDGTLLPVAIGFVIYGVIAVALMQTAMSKSPEMATTA